MDTRFLRVGAVSGIVGAVLAGVTNALHPRPSEYGSGFLRSQLTDIAESDAWIGIHVGIFFAIVLTLAALVAGVHSLRGTPGEHWARLAYASLLVGGGAFMVSIGVDGYAMKEIADTWQASDGTNQVIIFAAAHSAIAIGWGSFMIWTLSLLGVTPALFGAAVLSSDIYPRWLGWLSLVGGAGGLVSGLMGIYRGPSAAFFWIFTASSVLTTVLILALSVLMWRMAAAREPARAAAG